MLDEALVASDKVTSLDIRGATGDQVRRVLEAVLLSDGFSMRREGPVNYVDRIKPEDVKRSVFTYIPKFRTVSYLENAVRAFVSKGRFGGGISSTVSPVAIPQSGQGMTPQVQQQVQQSTQGQSVMQVAPGGAVSNTSMDVLLFQGDDREVELVRSLVMALDAPPRELAVRATVFEVQTQSSDSSAVQLAASLLRGKVSFAYGALSGTPTAAARIGDFDAAVALLAQDSRFRLMSSPSLRVTSGDVARVAVGADVPVLGSVTIAASGAAQQSVSYQASGVIFDLRPVALGELVRVNLTQQVSNFVATTSGVNGSPTLLKREVSSTVGVRSGELVLIGGLDETTNGSSGAGLHWLPRFLWSTSSSRGRTELVILLKVDVLDGSL